MKPGTRTIYFHSHIFSRTPLSRQRLINASHGLLASHRDRVTSIQLLQASRNDFGPHLIHFAFADLFLVRFQQLTSQCDPIGERQFECLCSYLFNSGGHHSPLRSTKRCCGKRSRGDEFLAPWVHRLRPANDVFDSACDVERPHAVFSVIRAASVRPLLSATWRSALAGTSSRLLGHRLRSCRAAASGTRRSTGRGSSAARRPMPRAC